MLLVRSCCDVPLIDLLSGVTLLAILSLSVFTDHNNELKVLYCTETERACCLIQSHRADSDFILEI